MKVNVINIVKYGYQLKNLINNIKKPLTVFVSGFSGDVIKIIVFLKEFIYDYIRNINFYSSPTVVLLLSINTTLCHIPLDILATFSLVPSILKPHFL